MHNRYHFSEPLRQILKHDLHTSFTPIWHRFNGTPPPVFVPTTSFPRKMSNICGLGRFVWIVNALSILNFHRDKVGSEINFRGNIVSYAFVVAFDRSFLRRQLRRKSFGFVEVLQKNELIRHINQICCSRKQYQSIW